MKNRYVKTRRWVAGGCAALFIGLVGVLFARDHQPVSVSAEDDAVAAPAPVVSQRALVLPTTTPSTTRTLPSTTSQLPSTRNAPSTTTQPQPQTTTVKPHTRTRAS